MDDDTGISVVLVNSEKGASLFNRVALLCDLAASDYADIRRTNLAVYCSTNPHPKRTLFFKCIRAGADFDLLVLKLLKRPLWRRVGSFMKRVVKKAICK